MALSNDLVSQFAKLTNNEPKPKEEITVSGSYKEVSGEKFVQIDGSDIWTPVSSTVEAKTGERVTVLLKNHTATVTGNLSSPSARTGTVQDLKDEVDEYGNTIQQINNSIIQQDNSITQINNNIQRQDNTIQQINNTIIQQDNTIIQQGNNINQHGDSITSMNNTITQQGNQITSINNTVTQHGNIITQQGNTITQQGNSITQQGNTITQHGTNIETFDSDIRILNSGFVIQDGVLTGLSSIVVNELKTNTLDAEYANIDFANINIAAVQKIFADSGIIENLVVSSGHITGELVGVTIKGDLIEGNTIVANKLVILGDDGLYYELNTNGESITAEQTDYNSLNGSIITANTITAEKINVDDLVAFNATIGGYHIGNNSLYSGAKNSIDNSTEGIYLGDDGQIAIGDGNKYIKFFKYNNDGEEINRLEIQVDDIKIGTGQDSVSNKLNTIIDAEGVQTAIDNNLENGVQKVRTGAGYTLDDNGLTITRVNSEMSTNIDDNGMSVLRDDDEVLTADSTGVSAFNLHARTYLVIGETSRFEDFIKNGELRTGCFWIS